MSARTASVIFDLDGTLSNPLDGINRSLNYALESFGYAAVSPGEAMQHIGPPLDAAFRKITRSKDEAEIRALVSKYRERYSDVGYAENVLYPGVREGLRGLADRKIVMGVCTTKRKDFAVRILDMFGLLGLFLFVEGGDVGIEKRETLRGLCEAGLVAPGAVMVGDRALDMIAARECDLDGGGVLWGFGSREEIEAEEPVYLFESPTQWAALRWA